MGLPFNLSMEHLLQVATCPAFMRSYDHEEQTKASEGHPTLEDFLGSKSKAHHGSISFLYTLVLSSLDHEGETNNTCINTISVFDHSRLMNARVLCGIHKASFSLSSLKNYVLSVYKDYKTPNDGLQGSNQNFARDIGIPRRALTSSTKGVDIENEGMHRQFLANGRSLLAPLP